MDEKIIDIKQIKKDYIEQCKSNPFNENPYDQEKLKNEKDINWPETNNKGAPLNTYVNLKFLLSLFHISVRWNRMSWIREVTIPSLEIFSDDEENSSLLEITNLAARYGFPTSRIDEHLTSLSQQRHYHPIVDCILSKPWDGTPRLDKFIKCVKTNNNSLAQKLIRRWMVSAIAAIFNPNGIAPQGILIFQGRQNIGKTQWVKSLDPIGCGAILESALLDPSCKDSVINLARHWINELGELDATFKKSDIARLKGYITADKDELRLPYARKITRMKRRSVCFGTVNDERFLVDDTGNRRWWVIGVESIDSDHGLDIQQIWAEVHDLYKKNPQHWLSAEELDELNQSNEEHELIDPFEEAVLRYFAWGGPLAAKMTASHVLNCIGFTSPHKKDSMRMSKILERLTGLKSTRNNNKRVFLMPRLKNGAELSGQES